MNNPTSLYLGIDTGGTFTDGVLLDPLTRQVIKSVKVLTSHHNLEHCIAAVLDQLVPEDPSIISLVSLSTTLATNAIAEGKRKPVALLLLGYDPELVHKFKFHLEFGTPHYYFLKAKYALDGTEQATVSEEEVNRIVSESQDQVEAFAVSAYAGSRNPTHEEQVGEMIALATHKPVVQGHHLSNEIDSIRRATTVSLNASLLSNTQEFLTAVQAMLAQHQVTCPVMMVRGDGSIVKSDFARKRPVEIIHSGPATSAIGGQFLSGLDTALVIDIGGTTTDIALVNKGKVQIEEKSATVGPYRTCIKTVKIRSFGLGGDSRIRFDRSQSLTIGPERVLPLCHLAHQFSQVRQELIDWIQLKGEIHYDSRLEFWILRREPAHPFKDKRTQQVIDLLKNGPILLPKLLKQVGAVSPIQVNVDDLVNREIIERAGLTPTDLLHASGEFTPWDVEIARLLVSTVAKNWEESPTAFIARVKNLVTERITSEVIQFLTGKTLSDSTINPLNDRLDRWLFSENRSPVDAHISARIFLKDPIVGIGAPASAFLPAVAAELGTQIYLPEHFAVANAVGAVVGSVIIRMNGEVSPVIHGTDISGYMASAAHQHHQFAHFEEAVAWTRAQLSQLVIQESQIAGALSPTLEWQEKEILPGCMLQLSAWAMGKPL